MRSPPSAAHRPGAHRRRAHAPARSVVGSRGRGGFRARAARLGDAQGPPETSLHLPGHAGGPVTDGLVSARRRRADHRSLGASPARPAARAAPARHRPLGHLADRPVRRRHGRRHAGWPSAPPSPPTEVVAGSCRHDLHSLDEISRGACGHVVAGSHRWVVDSAVLARRVHSWRVCRWVGPHATPEHSPPGRPSPCSTDPVARILMRRADPRNRRWSPSRVLRRHRHPRDHQPERLHRRRRSRGLGPVDPPCRFGLLVDTAGLRGRP